MSETNVIEFTPAAASKLKELLVEQKQADAYLRISAEKDADGRLNYHFGIDTAADEGDAVMNGNVKAVLDANSVELMRGSSIDYVESLQRSGFTVSNPNVKGCACGGGGCCGGK